LSRGNRSQRSRERTEQERERDRQERLRRRAARAGEPSDDAAAFERSGAERHPVVPEPAETRPGAAEPPAVESSAAELPAAELPAAEPPAAELPITETHAAEGALQGAGSPPEVEPDLLDIPPEAVRAAPPTPPVEPPSGLPGSPLPIEQGPAGRSPLSQPADGGPKPTGARWPAAPRRRPLLARAGAFLALAAVIAAVWLLVESLAGPGKSKPVSGGAVVSVVIPEGETRLQIARIAAADGLAGSYMAASKSSPLLNPTSYGAPAGRPDLEGFLFPATYELNGGAPVTQLVAEQLKAFRRVFGTSMIRRAQHLHTTAYRLLTIASMIEREAKAARDRPLIAAVIYNRLNRGMPLGIDATIYYALALRSGIAAYSRELTEAQLHIDSPYNTRLHGGLPPTPISNPGKASIEAAAHPAHVPYIYYVLAADGCGEHVFSTTAAQFERNVGAYQAAVKKAGGHPLTCKAK
jgi:cell division protein YceG involved in septum cleavage